MSNNILKVLFLCTGNSARSIMAESYLNHAGHGKCLAFSAGSFPKGMVHPLALKTLRSAGLWVDSLRSKSWDEFASASAPRMDLILTVCDNAAGEACPFWPGAPCRAHWSFRDPAAFDGSEDDQQTYFAQVFAGIRGTIDRLIALPLASFDARALSEQVDKIAPR